jgi:hypothetical protein
MCEISVSGSGANVEFRCKKTGKPITVTNEYGMFCEDLCGLEEMKKEPGNLTEFFQKMASEYEPDIR